MMFTDTERRSIQRFSASGLSLEVNDSAGVNEFSEVLCQSARIIDFNHSGIALLSDKNYKVGETVRLRISDSLESIEDLLASVCNRAKTEAGYRCGLHFSYAQAAHKEVLLSMERRLVSTLAV